MLSLSLPLPLSPILTLSISFYKDVYTSKFPIQSSAPLDIFMVLLALSVLAADVLAAIKALK